MGQHQQQSAAAQRSAVDRHYSDDCNCRNCRRKRQSRAHAYETSDECRSSEHQHCNRFAGDYDTYVCACWCHGEDGSGGGAP
jgi:hypothetical protein